MKPILFNTEMVRAILKWKKTTTRRIIKVNNVLDVIGTSSSKCNDTFDMVLFGKLNKEKIGNSNVKERIKAPYLPGDILYVRETWCKGSLDYQDEKYYYKADNNNFLCKWHPSIHMPKEAARIFLKVTDVRVERLQDMKAEDFWSEGIETGDFDFKNLWNSTINKKDLCNYGWGANPYVWVIQFEIMEVKS